MRRFKKFLSMVSAFLILISMTPTQAAAADAEVTGDYVTNDFNQIQAFLNLPSTTPGKRNGDMISATTYDPNNPETWTGVQWTSEVPKRVESIGIDSKWGSKSLHGSLKLNNCAALEYVDCGNNEIDSVSLTNMPELVSVLCNDNQITGLDLSGSVYVHNIYCQDNLLISLNIDDLRSLEILESQNNHLTSIQVYFVEGTFYVDANDGGYVELKLMRMEGTTYAYAKAVPLPGRDLDTWILVREWDYGNEVNPIDLYELNVNRAEAVFTGGEEGTYYTVTFDPNGGTTGTSSPLVQHVREGEAAFAPDVYRNGYTFTGWDKSFSEVTRDMTVTAQWRYNGPSTYPEPPATVVGYVVNFDPDGGYRTGGGNMQQFITDGNTATAPTVVKEGYSLTGWSTSFEKVTSNLNVIAKWEPANYTVTFDPDGGEKTGGGDLVQKVVIGSAATAPVVAREGYDFDDWDSDFSKVTKDLTVKALWKTKEFTVTFDPAGGFRSGGGKLKQTVAYGGSAEEPTVEKDGSTFEGWDMEFTDVTEDITVTATWEEIASEEEPVYTVTYDLNGGLGDAPMDDNEYLEGDTAALVDGSGLDYSKYKFLGWALTPDGEVLSEEELEVNNDMMLYAIWEEIVEPTEDVPKTGDIPVAVNYGIPMLLSGGGLIGLSAIKKRKFN